MILILCLLMAVPGCRPDPMPVPTPVVPSGPYYLKEITTTPAGGTPVTAMWTHYYLNFPQFVTYAYDNYKYDTVSLLLTEIYFTGGTSATGQVFKYDASRLPVGAKKNYSFYGATGGSEYTTSDSVIYKVENGKITEAITCNHRRSSFAPGGNTFSTDTTVRVTISYVNDNPYKIHIVNTGGNMIDLEYTWGSKKSPLLDSKIKYLLNPDDAPLQSSTTQYVTLFASNELTGIKKTITAPNGTITTDRVDFVYTYNDAGYPVTAQGTQLNGVVFSQQFLYK